MAECRKLDPFHAGPACSCSGGCALEKVDLEVLRRESRSEQVKEAPSGVEPLETHPEKASISGDSCKTCAKVQPWTKWDGRDGVVSPSGVIHIGMEDGDTACGKDATGEHWWWPL